MVLALHIRQKVHLLPTPDYDRVIVKQKEPLSTRILVIDSSHAS